MRATRRRRPWTAEEASQSERPSKSVSTRGADSRMELTIQLAADDVNVENGTKGKGMVKKGGRRGKQKGWEENEGGVKHGQ